MADQIAYPFRLGMHGRVVVSRQGSDQEAQEAIQQIVETRPNELLFAEEFGVPDPAYLGIDTGDVQATLNMFGPSDIEVRNLETHYIDETRTRLTFEWDRDVDRDEGEDDE